MLELQVGEELLINPWNYFPIISMYVFTIHQRYRQTDVRTDDILTAIPCEYIRASLGKKQSLVSEYYT